LALSSGTAIGRYEIIEPLGQGGMATVYKARQPSLERVVALKVIRPGFSDDPEFLERFKREARAVARLDHPNVVQVYDFDQVDGRAFLAMQYLEGGTLRDRVAQLAQERRLLPQAEVARIVEQVASALAYGHGLGVVHRDVKPANIMLTRDGRAVVTDFGIARMLGGTQLTATGVGIGTPEYMSPEQGQGTALDARSDEYSLGVVVYELLTGSLPFTGDTPFAVVLKHVRDPLPPARQLNPAVNADTEAVLAKALAKDPSARYLGVVELADALRSALGVGERVTAPTVVTPRAAPAAAAATGLPSTERARVAVGGAVAIALLAVLLLDALPRAATLDLAALEQAFQTSTASPGVTASPEQTRRPAQLRPEQMIMPAAEFPLEGYRVSTDTQGRDENVWRREFSSTGPSDITDVEFVLTVDPGGNGFVPTQCERFTWSGEAPVPSALSSSLIGDRSQMCRFRFPSGNRYISLEVESRNVEILVWVFARTGASDAQAAEVAERLARQQLAIVDRVAPP